MFHRLDLASPLAQLVVGPAKLNRREHVLDVAVIAKRPRLANQRINHMPIVEQHLAFAKLSWHPFHALTPVPQFDLVLLNPRLDLQTDQFAVNRVSVLSNVKQAV